MEKKGIAQYLKAARGQSRQRTLLLTRQGRPRGLCTCWWLGGRPPRARPCGQPGGSRPIPDMKQIPLSCAPSQLVQSADIKTIPCQSSRERRRRKRQRCCRGRSFRGSADTSADAAAIATVKATAAAKAAKAARHLIAASANPCRAAVHTLWYYSDATQTMQGPFDYIQSAWYDAGYMTATTLCSPSFWEVPVDFWPIAELYSAGLEHVCGSRLGGCAGRRGRRRP